MPDPLIPQGNLNRIKASLLLNDFPELNVNPSYMGRDQLSIDFDGQATGVIPTSTGLVNSPEAFQPVTIMMHLLKTQPLAAAYEAQRQKGTLLGNGVIWPDLNRNTGGIPSYSILNISIHNVGGLRFNGTDESYRVTIGGYMIINSSLWD